jgi:hypothetical protein
MQTIIAQRTVQWPSPPIPSVEDIQAPFAVSPGGTIASIDVRIARPSDGEL